MQTRSSRFSSDGVFGKHNCQNTRKPYKTSQFVGWVVGLDLVSNSVLADPQIVALIRLRFWKAQIATYNLQANGKPEIPMTLSTLPNFSTRTRPVCIAHRHSATL